MAFKLFKVNETFTVFITACMRHEIDNVAIFDLNYLL